MNREDIDMDEKGKEDFDMARVDKVMAELFSPPSGMENRIMAAVRGRAPAWRQNRISIWQRPWVRYSAAAAAIVVILGVWMRMGGIFKPQMQRTYIAASTVENQNNGIVDSAGGASPSLDENSVADKSSAGAELDDEDLRLDRYFSRQGSSFQNASKGTAFRLAGVRPQRNIVASGESLHVVIPSAVTHIWVVPELDKAAELLARIGKANEKNVLTKVQNDEQMIYSVTLSDVEVQSMVNLLYSQNWSLVSPVYPQPQEEFNADFTGRMVNYVIQIVKQQ